MDILSILIQIEFWGSVIIGSDKMCYTSSLAFLNRTLNFFRLPVKNSNALHFI